MNAEINIEIQGLAALLQRLDECRRLPDPIYQPLHAAMSQAVQLVEAQAKDNLTAHTSVASDALRATGVGSTVELTAAALTGSVYADIRNGGFNYAAAVEYGTRAGYVPPLEPLETWVRLKGLTGVVTLARRKAQRQAQVDAIRATAQRVRWGIYHYGTQAHPFLMPAFAAQRPAILALFEAAVARLVANFCRR